MKTHVITTENERTDLIHITRVNGEITEVSKETVFSGPISVFVGKNKVGMVSEYRLEVPVYQRKGRV